MLDRGAVAFLLDCCPPTWTSQEEFHARLTSSLRDRGVGTVVVLSGEPIRSVRDRYEAAGATVEALSYKGRIATYFRAVRALLHKHAVSLVHVRYFDYFSLVPWIARAAGARHIVLTDANGGEWRPRGIRAVPVQIRARMTTAPVTRIIAISQFIRRRLVAVGVPPGKISVVYNGVDRMRYAPDADARSRLRSMYGIAPGEIAISTIGAWRPPWKKPEVIVAAVAKIALETRLPVKLLFAGDGPLCPALQRLASELGIADRVIWLGRTAEPWNVLRASDIFAFASRGEAFGYVVAEALASGVPVVSANSGAFPEIVEDGRSGLLAETEDPADFAKKICVLAGNEALRKQYSCAALKRAEERFGIERAVANTLDVYDSII